MTPTHPTAEPHRRRVSRFIGHVLATGRFLAVGVVTCVLISPLVAGWLLGWQIVQVDGGSMAPTYAWGDVIVIDTSSHRELTQDSVVTARRPDGVLYTHRIISVAADGSAITQGDANPIPDSDPINQDEVVGFVIAHIPQPWATAVTATQTLPGRVSLGILLTGLILIPAIRTTTPPAHTPPDRN